LGDCDHFVRSLYRPASVLDVGFRVGRTIRKSQAMNMITLINVFRVEPANQQRLVDLLVRVTDEFVRQSPGFISSTLHRSFDGSKVTMYAQWKSVEEYEAMRRDRRPLPFFEEALTLAKFDLGMYEVVRTFSPVGSP
jgi:quinol monooxygenase YgiN